MTDPDAEARIADGALPPATTSWSTGLVAFTASPALALGGVGLAVASLVLATCGAVGKVAPGIAWPVALGTALLGALAFWFQARVDPLSDPEDRPGPPSASIPIALPHAPGDAVDSVERLWKSRSGHVVFEPEGIRLRWKEFHHGLILLFVMVTLRMRDFPRGTEFLPLAIGYGLIGLQFLLLARRHERFLPWSALAGATAVGTRIVILPRRDGAVTIVIAPRSRARIVAALAERIPVQDLPGRAGIVRDRSGPPPRPPVPPKPPSRDAADPRTGKSLDRALGDLRRM